MYQKDFQNLSEDVCTGQKSCQANRRMEVNESELNVFAELQIYALLYASFSHQFIFMPIISSRHTFLFWGAFLPLFMVESGDGREVGRETYGKDCRERDSNAQYVVTCCCILIPTPPTQHSLLTGCLAD